MEYFDLWVSCMIKSLKLPKSGNQLQFLIQRVPSGRTSNALSIPHSGKGHYARNFPKPRVRDSKYYMEQMLLAKQEKAGVILTNEQNDFLFADASRMEEIEDLSANICLMAIIQPTNHSSDVGLSYDSAFVSEVQSSSINENKEQMYPTHTKIINSTIGDDQIDSNIIFDTPNGNVNSGGVKKDTLVPNLCALEQLARNAYQEAKKQQIFPQKVQKQNNMLTSQLELYKERVRVLENINEDNNYLNKFLEADQRAKHFDQQAHVRRSINRDSHDKNSILANFKNSAKKVAVYVRKNKQTDNTFANVISNKENVTDVVVANASKPVTAVNKANKIVGPKEANNSAGAARANSTNYVNTASTPVNTTSTIVNTARTPVNTSSPSRNVRAAEPSYHDLSTFTNQDESQIPSLEDIYEVPNDGIFTSASYDDEGAVADFTNLESTMNFRQGAKLNPRRYLKQLKMKVGLMLCRKSCCNSRLSKFGFWLTYLLGRKIEAIRIFLAFASYMRFIVYQMDVKSAFLYGKINEEKENGIFISQDEYVAEILKKFDFISVKTASTSIKTKKPLVKDVEADDVTLKTLHLHAVKRIFRYLKGQPKLGLWYPRESAFNLEAYSDSDYAGANLDRKSTTRGLFSPKMRSLGKEHVSKQVRKKAKTGTNIEESTNYVVNEGSNSDKVKVINAKAEGISVAGETLNAANLIEAKIGMREFFKCWFHHHTTNGHQFTMSNRHQKSASPKANGFCKELASPKQTALGKDSSNPLMADSLPKTMWLSIAMKHWLFQDKWNVKDAKVSNEFKFIKHQIKE
nr:hypothetical protein [Tanacetum cinerariifolium]